ncbi:hypothetical protein CONCODRAFT_11495 [Conidiobolus coronatus NRRL 28638]|uniref:F-box domain-containing protein n=1 Tax=Conidiobolus coronatus (strain ATCC 28846 / CBS 209.66 / NRRL 28638) TaxID=796925 RepID=A0A137NV48_CONC2|nr:hypothetical protein CONCODRAFT_11495 [Conidiobolus coronatus NRRL 28638]|eukprot:KXN66612.1 hypothetical protein CONCODRAFT_11495 [Conidiobolus coronatus NRRL 28638]
MERENTAKINWLNIIFHKEFQKYLSLDILKELSLLSKSIRIKLSPRLFYAIILEQNSKRIYDKFTKYYNLRELSVLATLLSSSTEELQKGLHGDKILSDIKSELESVERFVFSLYLKRLFNIGYYLIPVLMSFNELVLLKLKECTVPYSLLVNLGLSFPKLESFELNDLLLVRLSTDIEVSYYFDFPINLQCLKLILVNVVELNTLSNPYEILFNKFDAELSSRFKLPQISIPSLRKLEFIDYYEEDYDLEEFLDLNPNLESLKIESLNLGRVYNFNSIKSLETNYVDFFDDELAFPSQNGIIELKIFIEHQGDFENVKKLCRLCPNLEKLHFSIPYDDSPQQSLEGFLIPVLSKLPKVKTLNLKLHTSESDILNINKLPYVENIVFEIDKPYILNIKFNNCINLKKLEIKSPWFELDDKLLQYELRMLRRKYENWTFKLYKHKLKGYKIVNKLP